MSLEISLSLKKNLVDMQILRLAMLYFLAKITLGMLLSVYAYKKCNKRESRVPKKLHKARRNVHQRTVTPIIIFLHSSMDCQDFQLKMKPTSNLVSFHCSVFKKIRIIRLLFLE